MDYSKLSDNTLKTLKEGKPLDYSKLNDDELLELKKTSSQQSPSPEIKHRAPEEDTSKLESLLRGVQQGVTFGFGDEINAGLESAFTDKTYDQAREESRANFEKASSDNPLTTLLGNLAGGIAVPIPGAAGASLGRMALIGAGGGALAGLGASEADLTKGEIGQAGEDILEGAAIGGALGVGVGALSKGVGAASRAWKDTDNAKHLSKMVKYAKADPEFNSSATLNKTSKMINDTILDEYLPALDSIKKAIDNQFDLARKMASADGRNLDFKEFRTDIIKQLDAVKIKDANYQKGRKIIEEYLDAIGEVERTQRLVPLPDADLADEAINSLKTSVGKSFVTEDSAIREFAKRKALDIAEGRRAASPKTPVDVKEIEEDIFTYIKSKRSETFNPKYGVDIDPTTGKKFATAQYDTPTGVTKMKAKEFGDDFRTEDIETIGRPKLNPDILDATSKKGQEIFDNFNTGNETTRSNYDLAEIGLNIKKTADKEAMDPIQGEIADFMFKKFGEIKANLGLDFKGKSGQDLTEAKLDAADKIKNMLITAAKKPGNNGEIRFDEANAIAKQLSEAGYIDGNQIAQTAEKLKILAEQEFLMRTAQGESFLSSNAKNHFLIPFSAKAKGLQIADAYGKTLGVLERSPTAKLATNTMRYITADPEIIGSLATKLEQSKSSFAPVIRNLASQPEQKRKAMMFSLMQQRAFRQAINVDEEE